LAELEKIQEGLAQAERGEFMSDEEMEAFFARYGAPARPRPTAREVRRDLSLPASVDQ